MSNLKNKTIWLTGASSGIGYALFFELINRGARVAITSRNAQVLNEMIAAAKAKGIDALAFAGDVQDLAQMKAFSTEISKSFGKIDILVANAGTHLFTKPEQFDSKEYLDLMNVNYGGMLHCIEAVLPAMLERKAGQIVGMASLAGYRGLPRAAAYGASKAAIINFLESIRFHVRRHGVSVNIVNPGFVKTPLTDKNDFHMPFRISAEKSAQLICDGIEQNRKEISFPIPFNWLLKLGRMLPYPIYEFFADRVW